MECDFLIIGGGSAGAVLAARLSEDSGNQVILVEAGSRARGFWISTPLGMAKLVTGDRHIWPFWTSPQEAMRQQRIYWPRGKALGGSSIINGMLWTRGDVESFDNIRDMGCPGWGWHDVLPYFIKCESWQGPVSTNRGGNGPVTISQVLSPDPITRGFVEACQTHGFPLNEDFNDGDQLGVSDLQYSIRAGKRCSTDVAYLEPAIRRANLRILTETTAERIVFCGRRATGVTVQRESEKIGINARREVILCAGALKSPQLLELSGVGDGERLRGLGLDVLHHNPSVGENLIDHMNMRLTFRTNKKITLNDAINNRIRGVLEGAKYIFAKKGLLSFPAVSAHALKRLHPEERSSLVKIQVGLISGSDRYSNDSDGGLDDFSGFNIGTFQVFPKSRGHVHAISADPHADPEMTANYLADSYDRALAVEQLRLAREVSRQPAMADLIMDETRPGLAVDDDESLLDYGLATGQTCWHPIGSLRMGVDDAAVLSPDLKVRGLESLRVVDASIFPDIPASNTNAPTIMAAEKISDRILQAD